MRGFLAGSLALIVFESVLARSENAGALVSGVAGLFQRFLSPQVAAVPDVAARRAAAADAAAKASKASPSSSAVNPTVAPFVSAGLAQPRQSAPAGA